MKNPILEVFVDVRSEQQKTNRASNNKQGNAEDILVMFSRVSNAFCNCMYLFAKFSKDYVLLSFPLDNITTSFQAWQ